MKKLLTEDFWLRSERGYPPGAYWWIMGGALVLLAVAGLFS